MVLDVLLVVFTGVIAAATIVYAYFALKLWKETRRQAQVARYMALMGFLGILDNAIEANRESNPAMTQLLQAFGMVLTDLGMERMLEEINIRKDSRARDYFRQIEGILLANGVDPQSVPWMRPILRKLNP